MIDLLVAIALACWNILAESSPYVLFGFFAAGLLQAMLPRDAIARHLGSNSVASVLKASLFGIPLPLCSCGVIPAAIELRKQGASKGASAAFLVSVPETGVDSIAITWALLDPLMTLFRPISAFLTATLTGLLINRLPEDSNPALQPAACGCSSSCCGNPPVLPFGARLRDGLSYAFSELLGDIGRWLMVGIVVAGIIAATLPADFFTRFLHNEGLSLLVMLLAGIPLYICASASTPVAAAMVLKGLSPGAALVFLLAGPATNAATISLVYRFWGRATTLVYLASIAFSSLVLGWLLNRIYDWTQMDISRWMQNTGTHSPAWFEHLCALVLLALLVRSLRPKQSPSCGCDH